MSTCTATLGENRCNRPEGHSGAHGFELQPGLVIAPFYGSSGPDAGEAEESGLACDCCHSPLMVYLKTRTFVCTNAECHQRHIFTDDDRHLSSVCARLYPAWDRQSRDLKIECLAFSLSQGMFELQAKLLLGDLDQDDFEQGVERLKSELAEWEAKIPPAHIPIWKRLFDGIRRRSA